MHAQRLRSRRIAIVAAASTFILSSALVASMASAHDSGGDNSVAANLSFDPGVAVHLVRSVAEGQQTFRHDTFGDESFWGDTLKLHLAIEGQRFGGVGAGLTPRSALALGLKVDMATLPRSVRNAIRNGQVDLDDPRTTLDLLRLDAVIGVKGTFDGNALRTVGITCALCHSTVDDSLTTGIGNRRDGWANRDLDVGAIIALAPDLSPFSRLLGVPQEAVRSVLRGWGPGKFDAELLLDGKTTNPFTGRPSATCCRPPSDWPA